MSAQMTARQIADWPGAVERLQKSAEYNHLPTDPASWNISFAEESRPGRGHAINATYLDGEVFAQILMDVYGYPTVSIAILDWVHADSNEECECAPCVAERADEAEAEAVAEGGASDG